MKKRWLLNLALIALLATLSLVAFYQPGQKKEPAGTPLTELTTDSVQRIRLQRGRQPEIVLEKSGEQWRMTAPRVARASEYRVRELLRLATTPVQTHFTPAAGALGTYGLEAPGSTVWLNDTALRFGGMHPLENNVYVLSGQKVWLVPGAHLRAAQSGLEDLLSPNLLDDQAKIQALRFPGFSLKQNEQGAWVRTPELKTLSSDRVNRFVEEWRLARALLVAPAAGKAARERVTITILRHDKPVAIEFGVITRKPELVLVRYDEKLEYHFPEDVGARLLDLQPDPEPPATAEPGREKGN